MPCCKVRTRSGSLSPLGELTLYRVWCPSLSLTTFLAVKLLCVKLIQLLLLSFD